ncbi:type II secretion system major pseudopilin GspG [Parahaliea aestuarii]|uniref:Type II secretion system core protein G n=1 Tax=Parahaliea aestuarii TaxID=1852021 RepID=A0A5C8ZMR4_9GAMM|nr:type II secretion system major pseudopilin GspG [Parahaliea aestuarii]TXS89030.1 type II secretion system protein GspG [Parahaliea aestuarii]
MAFRKSLQGFTLLEIMVVVAIISLLVGMVAPNLMGRVDDAKAATARSDISTIMQALEMYRLDHDQYPSTQEGLEMLIESSSAGAGQKPKSYLKRSGLPTDPWGATYLYLSPGEHGDFDLYSLGADKREGGTGKDADIGSWEI